MLACDSSSIKTCFLVCHSEAMEGVEVQNILIRELMQGCELIRKLEDQLEKSCSIELRKSLVKSIMDRWEKAMSLAKLMIPQEEKHLMDPTSRTVSPRSAMDSPKSINFEHAVYDQKRREICKKRKAMPKWVRHVRLCTGTGLEGHPEDGFSWRKYGQKDILGSKHPRSYYRCTRLYSQGCLARKQVQRSDEDPSIVDVLYRGEHSCFSKQSLNKDDDHVNLNHQMHLNQAKTEDLDRKNITTSLSFNSTPVRTVENDDYNHIFSSPSPDAQFFDTCIFSPLTSPVKSDSSYYSLTMCPDSRMMDLPAINLPEMNLTTDTLIAGFGLDGLELESNFPFETSCFA